MASSRSKREERGTRLDDRTSVRLTFITVLGWVGE